jgi:hypothetical protein
MKIRIMETGEIRELNISDKNGTNWTNDLILNVESLNYNDESEAYEMTQEQYNWWKQYVEDYEADEKEAAELAEELGIEEHLIWDKYNEYHTCDYGDHHTIKQNVFAEIRDEYK